MIKYVITYQPQSLRFAYFRKFLWPTRINSLKRKTWISWSPRSMKPLPLVILLLVDSPTDPFEHLTLEFPHKFDDNLISNLFQIGKSTSPVEDHGVAQPVAVPAELDFVQQRVNGDLVV